MSSELLSLPLTSPSPIECLSELGFSDALIGRWRQRGHEALLPLQVRAITETGLLDGASLVVSAIPSSGKTFVAELAALRQHSLGRRSVFLVPTKALAEELYAGLAATYSPLGLRVVIATRERRHHDPQIRTGGFDLAVMVYERFAAFLGSVPQFLRGLGLVVADELQILGDRERGWAVDLLLTRLVASRSRVQIVALSGVLPEAERIAEWLNAETLVFEERPLELREGVYCDDTRTFTWREVRSGREGEECLSAEEYLPAMEVVESISRRPERDQGSQYYKPAQQVIRALTGLGQQVLLFVPTKGDSRRWALRLAAALGLPPCEAALKALEEHEPSRVRTDLETCLRAGVGFHNSSLGFPLRRLLENEVRAGRLPVLVSTSTLAEGVNLSVPNVVQVPLTYESCFYETHEGLVQLSRRAFRNQGNRAARCGDARPVSFGRSIVLTTDTAEAFLLTQNFLRNEVEPLQPEFDIPQIQNMAMPLVTSGAVTTEALLREFLTDTYMFRALPPSQRRRLETHVRAAIENLESCRVLDRASGRLCPTSVAECGTAHGLLPRMTGLLGEWCRQQADAEREGARLPGTVHDLELLALCAREPDGFSVSMGVGGGGSAWTPAKLDPVTAARSYGWDLAQALPSVRDFLASPTGVTKDAARTFRKATLAMAWVSPRLSTELEAEHRLDLGTLAALGLHFSWILHALVSVAETGNVHPETLQQIASLARRIVCGLPPAGEGLAWIDGSNISRTQWHAILAAGYRDPAAVAAADAAVLAAITGGRAADELIVSARELVARRPHLAQRLPVVDVQPVSAGHPAPAPVAPPAGRNLAREFELRLHAAHPGCCVLRGEEVRLTSVAFRLLVTLAQWPNQVVSNADILESVWGSRSAGRQYIYRARNLLTTALATVCGRDEAERLIERVHGHGLRLALAPDVVHCPGALGAPPDGGVPVLVVPP